MPRENTTAQQGEQAPALCKPYERTRAILNSRLPCTPRSVLVAVADHLSAPDGWCWPSVDRLSELCGRSARTVRRALADLRSWGVLSVEEVRGRSSRYQIQWAALVAYRAISHTPDMVSPLTQCHPCQTVTPDSMTYAPDMVTGAPDMVSPEVDQEADQEADHVRTSPAPEEPPAQPARTHVGQLLDSRSTALLVAAGITDAEDLLDHTRDSIAELCRPHMSRGRLDSIDAALRKWTRATGEERGLRACEPRSQASAEDGQPAEAWQLLLRGLSRFEQRPPWTTTPTDDGWALPGDEDRWRAAILAAGEEPDLITSWRVLYLRAGEQDRRWQERRFATAWRRALRGAA